jgi:hypothetical protein
MSLGLRIVAMAFAMLSETLWSRALNHAATSSFVGAVLKSVGS